MITEQEHDAMVTKVLDSIPGYPFLPCPICSGVEGCDHTIVERATEAERALENEMTAYCTGCNTQFLPSKGHECESRKPTGQAGPARPRRQGNPPRRGRPCPTCGWVHIGPSTSTTTV